LGRLRIVAGSLKGRRIVAPQVGDVRPTSERVREALFDILGGRVQGAGVLDFFAGSGAVGCEAISRGASEVIFVEADPRVARVLRANLEALGALGRGRLIIGDAVAACRGLTESGPFDVVFADPPYRGDTAERFLPALAVSGLLTASSAVVLERPARAAPIEPPPGLLRVREARYGDSRLDFYEPVHP